MKKWISRKSNRSGFTLTETLFAVMIMMLVSATLAAGLPVAASALREAVDASHAQVLLSTTMTAMRDELSMAKDIVWEVDETGKGKISYTDSAGVHSTIQFKDDSSSLGIFLSKNAALNGSGDAGSTVTKRDRRIVSDQAATDGLYEKFSDITCDNENGIVSINGLQVCRKKDGEDHVLADLGTVAFEIEVIGRKG